MVVLPSSAHADIAKAVTRYLKAGHMVILHPGRTLGALEFSKIIRECGSTAEIAVAKAETFIYASRADGPAQARSFRTKEAVPLAALPSCRSQLVLKAIQYAYPQFIDGVDILHTGLNHMGAIFHPALTLLNAGWIERTHGDYQFYIDGVTPSVARVLEVPNRERVTVTSAIGTRARTSLEWLKLAYGANGMNLHEAIHNQPGYYGIKAPEALPHGYIFKDVPMSLVPIASLGKRYGVSVRGMESIINLVGIIHRRDYWRRGSTAGNQLDFFCKTSEMKEISFAGVLPASITWIASNSILTRLEPNSSTEILITHQVSSLDPDSGGSDVLSNPLCQQVVTYTNHKTP